MCTIFWYIFLAIQSVGSEQWRSSTYNTNRGAGHAYLQLYTINISPDLEMDCSVRIKGESRRSDVFKCHFLWKSCQIYSAYVVVSAVWRGSVHSTWSYILNIFLYIYIILYLFTSSCSFVPSGSAEYSRHYIVLIYMCVCITIFFFFAGEDFRQVDVWTPYVYNIM